MENQLLREKLEITKVNLLNIEKIYKKSIFRYLDFGNHINSKLAKDNGLHLVNLSNEMYKLEQEIIILSNNKVKNV